MRMTYYPETDSLYIELSDRAGADVVEVTEDFAVDVDADGTPVGLEISAEASQTVRLSALRLERKEENGQDATFTLDTSFLTEPIRLSRSVSSS